MASTACPTLRRSLALMAGAALVAGSTFNGFERAYAEGTTNVLSGVPGTMPATPAPPNATTPPTPSGPLPVPPAGSAAPAAPRPPMAGPASVADLAAGLLDAVVNISTSQKVKGEGTVSTPKMPDGSPFQDLFNDFFKDKPGQSNNHKVSSLGSGFVIDPKGYVVTNNHVIEGADDIEVIFPDGTKLKAKLVGTDTKTDLSVLKVEPKQPLKSVHFGDSSQMRIGDWVMAVGNPFGLGGSVTVGIVSARGRNINAGPYDNFIQTDAAINKGNSGGPLFNMRGEVIGINTAIISPSGGSIGIGFSVPSEIAEGVVKQLMDFGETRRGWLGVRIQPVTDDVSESLGLPSAKGALVAGVIKGGPVDNGSIIAGDVILNFDGKAVNEMRDLPRVVAESPVGKAVDVVVMRNGKQETVKVTLGKLDDTPAAADDKSTVPDAAPGGSNGNGVINPDGDGAGDDDGMDDDQEDQGDAAPAPNADTVQTVLGMQLAGLNADNRKTFGIADSVDGVVVMQVAPGSPALEKGLKPGDVIVEVAQEFMKTPGSISAKVTSLKKEGRRNAQMMIAAPNGDLRFIAVPLE
ncbi:Do family serine endopeptidase [Rhizobium tumorigenes]|uniref:Probable periplasmic serine endoprotease DegP-like n=1 Tax=Rhizobium tumorigenes TaxID=2041385 RepID=A0AAF1KS97_9HYPH|nr:Do family serine endopeptidase [Rhizobium tumorigenes]WFR97208.1 Do family serine endopeptidase [Rhizobium tumorigenes]